MVHSMSEATIEVMTIVIRVEQSIKWLTIYFHEQRNISLLSINLLPTNRFDPFDSSLATIVDSYYSDFDIWIYLSYFQIQVVYLYSFFLFEIAIKNYKIQISGAHLESVKQHLL